MKRNEAGKGSNIHLEVSDHTGVSPTSRKACKRLAGGVRRETFGGVHKLQLGGGGCELAFVSSPAGPGAEPRKILKLPLFRGEEYLFP